MLERMRKTAIALLLMTSSSAAMAGQGASDFTLVNGTSGPLAGVSIRRAGSSDWKPLGTAAAAGARATVQFKDPDCAFDIRGKVGGSDVTWAGVNLCGAKSVTLKKDDTAGAWVDYDQ
jgi:hypothetical protein